MASLTDLAETALLYHPYDYYGDVYINLHKIKDLHYIAISYCSSLRSDSYCSSYLSNKPCLNSLLNHSQSYIVAFWGCYILTGSFLTDTDFLPPSSYKVFLQPLALE